MLERKHAFLGYKNKKFKNSKNWNFFKGVNPWFCSKNGSFSIFFWQYGQEKYLLRYCRTKKRLSRLSKQKVKKVEKLTFFPKGLTHVFGPRMAIFPSSFFGIIGQGNVFYHIPERKNAFLSYKKKIQKVENGHFSKGVNPWFWSKNGHYSNFFF